MRENETKELFKALEDQFKISSETSQRILKIVEKQENLIEKLQEQIKLQTRMENMQTELRTQMKDVQAQISRLTAAPNSDSAEAKRSPTLFK